MAGLIVETPPMCEPVALATMKDHLHVTNSDEDSLIQIYIQAARETVEAFTRRSYINKGFLQSHDSFPYYTDTLMSQQAYPPAYYSLPRYSTTLWNYSQMIKLFYSPLSAAPTLDYVATDGTETTLTGTTDNFNNDADFWADTVNQPPRLFPRAGGFWPPVRYHGNAIRIHYVAGVNNDAAITTAVASWVNGQSPAPTQAQQKAYEAGLRQADVPGAAVVAIMQLVAHWFDNRWGVMDGNLKEVPQGIQRLLWTERVLDMSPTRG